MSGAGRVMGIKQYAGHRGCSAKAVRKAMDSGRLVDSVTINPQTGYRQINVDLADREWEATTQVMKQRPRETSRPNQQGLFGPDPPEERPEPVDSKTANTMRRAMTLKLVSEARLKQMQVEERQGKKVDAQEVRDAQFSMARKLRDLFMLLPDRCGDDCAASSDPHECREIMRAEVRLTLESLGRDERP